ncbi:RNA polymerase sigma-70 factor (ECF subfamily) [Cytobacillus eiseniae]|uniref:RNA polymerase sigma factor n=1 Tax=Cytobacillus eiseniae TaxID=762947 RepID=A0ABS4RBZ3_9BACI|nr:RNA polymerase sigma factor [Cytobacillus eiseniae]MBP2239880.1 RNA polymerase sigma-70 factor (ECF subfamily) [Cytobacillus eiseniae]
MDDKQEITEWFHDYSDDILNFLIYYTGRVDVEDLVQEVYIRAFRRIHTFNRLSRPKTWLFTIARNIAIDEMRKEKKEKDKQQKFAHYQVHHEIKSPEDIYRLTETNKEIYQTIQTLKQSYRDVLILKGIKEMSSKETAEILNWSENKVRVTYNRGLKALENRIGGLSDES